MKSSIRNQGEFAFSSSQSPACPQRRDAFRISACLQAEVAWEAEAAAKSGIVTDLSGCGARLFVRCLHRADQLYLSLRPPDAFVRQLAGHRFASRGPLLRHQALAGDLFDRTEAKIRAQFDAIQARIVAVHLESKEENNAIYCLRLAFVQPSEMCYRLVYYLERQALQKAGMENLSVATAA